MNNIKDLPQLIVALDSVNEDANYIHIDDVKENISYYCPCCKGLIKPRAYKKDVVYQVQPHFYHESGGCNEETFVHYICKTWLFESGCKFIIDDVEYIVASIETEKTLHTSFGDYRPDIIVLTTSGKVFYFEIKVSNKKTEHYIPKWDALGNDVVEVDVRYFINQKHTDNIPKFELIYSDGECYIKHYIKNDYDSTIAKRKLEWKRQDKLNYKIQWERLDWFWCKLQEYKKDNNSKDDLLHSFNQMNYLDKIWCHLNLKGKSCIDLKDDFKNIIFRSFEEEVKKMIETYAPNKNYKLNIDHISPLIYEIKVIFDFMFKDYLCKESFAITQRTKQGIIPASFFDNMNAELIKLRDRYDSAMKKTTEILKLEKLYYIKSIVPKSHWISEFFNFSSPYFEFTIKFHDYILNQYTLQEIGECNMSPSSIFPHSINKKYKDYKSEALQKMDNAFIKYALKNNADYIKALELLKYECKKVKDLEIIISDDYRRIWLTYSNQEICSYEFLKNDTFDGIVKKVCDIFFDKISVVKNMIEIIYKYIDMINKCKNGLWNARKSYYGFNFRLTLNGCVSIDVKINELYNDENIIKDIIFDHMKSLSSGELYNIRLMEVRNSIG